VSFILKARHLGLLKSDVGSGLPLGRLSVGRFALDFGQTPAHIAALRLYLAQFGIHAKAYRDGLDVTAHSTAGKFDKALAVQQDNFRIPAVKAHLGQPGRPAMTIHGTTDKPLLPRNIARSVLAILGLTNYPVASSNAVHEPALAKGVQPAAVQTGSLTPEDFAKQYNLDPLYKAGFTGAGQTIGIVTLASIKPSDARFFWKHVLRIKTRSHKIKLVNVDGGAGKVSNDAGSGETTLDVEQSGAIAPGAKVVVYQAPTTDPGFLDAFYDAASQNVADTVSTSWGEAETVIDTAVASGAETPAYERSFDEAFLEMGAQGQRMFDTAGDDGAFDDSDELVTTNLAVDNPGDSPWATTAGGTTLAGTIPLSKTDSAHIPAQRAWGWDWLWPHFATFGAKSESAFAFAQAAGGGGGFSPDIPMPLYQRLTPGINQFSDAEYLRPIDPKPFGSVSLPTKWAFNPKPSVKTGTGFGRAVPDISTDADPFTGYEEYFTGFAGDPLEDGWGGTSFVAPQLNGATAVIDQAVGHRVGFWNPSIYRWAAGPHSPSHPLDSASAGNTNLFYTGTPGHVFDPASGLGTPNLAMLARDFARS
jgi:subtilase family serine protease